MISIIYIRQKDGEILSVHNKESIGTIRIAQIIPQDFYKLFSLGKYYYDAETGKIKENKDFVLNIDSSRDQGWPLMNKIVI